MSCLSDFVKFKISLIFGGLEFHISALENASISFDMSIHSTMGNKMRNLILEWKVCMNCASYAGRLSQLSQALYLDFERVIMLHRTGN